MSMDYLNLNFKGKIMKNKIIKLGLITILATNLYSNELTGDTKLACEALLCLSTPSRPDECIPSIKKFFSFTATRFYKLVEKRKNFLDLCPTGNENGMEEHKNNLSRITGTCDINELNKNIEKKVISISRMCDRDGYCQETENYGYRINPTLNNNCKILSSMQYSNYKLQYVCSKNFYKEIDWRNGYYKKEVSKNRFDSLNQKDKIQSTKSVPVSYNEYVNLPKEKRTMCKKSNLNYFQSTRYCRIDNVYYEKIYINKKCWINKE